jgi:hypothetical protein
MIFFGTNEESMTYFSRIGYPCPSKVTPTDYFLKISDSNFNDSKISFKASYRNSPEAQSLMTLLDDSISTSSRQIVTASPNQVFFLNKIYYLIYRDFALAYRDPTLYYLQVILLLGFGFMYGAIFFMLPTTTNTFTQVQGGVLWIAMSYSWMKVFGVFHMSRIDKRVVHEMSNNKYTALEFFIADLIATAVLVISFLPVLPIPYFMMGFPSKGFPFFILACWMVIL